MKNRKNKKRLNSIILKLTIAIIGLFALHFLVIQTKNQQVTTGKAKLSEISEEPILFQSEELPEPNSIIIKYRKNKRPVIPQEVKKNLKEDPKKIHNEIYTTEVVSENLLEETIQKLEKVEEIEYIEPDIYYQFFFTPNDTFFQNQWWLKKIEAEKAWDISQGKEQVAVGILDTGITNSHEDLSSKVTQWVSFASGNTYDDVGHGTMVGGVVGAVTNNNKGVASIGFKTKLISVKVGNKKGIKLSELIKSIKWAADNNIKIINLSLGSDKPAKALEEIIEYAWQKESL